MSPRAERELQGGSARVQTAAGRRRVGHGAGPAKLGGQQIGGEVQRTRAVGPLRDRRLRRVRPREQARRGQPHEGREGQREQHLEQREARLSGGRDRRATARDASRCGRAGTRRERARTRAWTRAQPRCAACAHSLTRHLTHGAAPTGARCSGHHTAVVPVSAGPSGGVMVTRMLSVSHGLEPSRHVRSTPHDHPAGAGCERQSNARTLRWKRSSLRIQAASSRRTRLERSTRAT